MNTQHDTLGGSKPQKEDLAFAVTGTLYEARRDRQHYWHNEHLICANKLLAQIELAQQDVRRIYRDMNLLMAMENALDAVSENLAKMQTLIKSLENGGVPALDRETIFDAITDLQTVTLLFEEDTEFEGIKLFDDGSIRLDSTSDEELFLRTSKLPVIERLDADHLEEALEQLKTVAGDINERYEDVHWLMYTLQSKFDGLRDQIDAMVNKRC